MPSQKTKKPTSKQIATIYNKLGTAEAVASHFKVSATTAHTWVRIARKELPEGSVNPPQRRGKEPHSATDMQDAVNAMVQHGTKAAAARALGLALTTFKDRLAAADEAGIAATIGGFTDAKQPLVWPVPPKGKIHRYVLTSAQNNTLIHEPTWKALLALCDHYQAQLVVGTITYVKALEGSAKRGTEGPADHDRMWYDSRLEPHIVDDVIQLAPGLIWNGDFNALPTAADPLSGMENYNYRNSSIFPHVKQHMRSVATVRAVAAKLQYTTGTVTQRNYIQKKTGLKAEFDHVYGGLLVEVNDEGHWWVRQLNVDSRGLLYDLDIMVREDGVVVQHDGVEAIQWGDIHVAQLEPEMVEASWGDGGMMDALKPRYQFLHDLLDFESRSHHNIRDPFVMYELHERGRDSVRKEIEQVGAFLRKAHRPWCKDVVVRSNHDEHFERWLRETSWKSDPVNAQIHADATSAYLRAIRMGNEFNALRWALETYTTSPDIVWADPDVGFIILKDRSGGLEMGLHGDDGPNGSRGSLRNLARLGRKICIGHSHSAGIWNGAWQSGVKGRLGMAYAKGAPSSWTQSDIVVHRNGKRQLVTWFKGRYRA